VRHRYKFYLTIFALFGLFDATTTLGSWFVKGTGLVEQVSGFPHDYVVAMFFLGLLLLTLYSAYKAKYGIISKGREIFLGIMTIACMALIGLIIVVMATWTY